MAEEEKKGTITELRDAWKRTSGALAKTRAEVERSTGAVMRAIGTDLGGFAAGVAHEAAGKMDERVGVKVLRVGGVHMGVLAHLAGLGAELLEAGGKNSEVLGAFTNGVGAQAAGDFGRLFVRNVRSGRAARTEDKAKTVTVEAPAALPDGVKASTAVATKVKEKVAV